ncbi:hypothetical protein BKA62DRAFT_703385 [Auriculariales sp. MPI-PUGE-AT-0066]|nr:hypothetical protein BKA62DRAFT_703385 [Auriculariales sp. MPI-PUGE-AT-0066]
MLFLSCVPRQHLGGMNMNVSNPPSVRDTGGNADDSAHNLSSRKVAVIAACVTSGVLLLLLVLALLWFCQRRQRLSTSLPRTSADGLLRQGVENGETTWRQPSYGSPPARSDTRQHQPQVWSSESPQPPVRVGEVEYNPYRESNDGEPGLAWSNAAQGVPRMRYAPAHTVPPPNPVVLRESFSGVHSRPQQHSTRSVGQPVVAFDTFDLPAQRNSPSFAMEAPQSESAFETQPRPSFPRSLERVGATEAAEALAQPPSASTTRWPLFGFSSGVPDEYAASPHTATTNATWRKSFYVPWRQRTLSGPRDRGSMAPDARRQRTLSLPQPESALPTSESAARGSPETLPGAADDDAQMPPADQLVIHDAPSTPHLSPSRRILPSLKVNTTLPPAPAFFSQQQPVAAQKRIKRKPVSALLGLRSRLPQGWR